MSRTFADSLTSDIENTFLNASEFAQSVTLTRSGIDTTGVPAMVAKRMYEVIDEGGLATAMLSVDFDVLATRYAFSGSQQDPRPGDVVTLADGSRHDVLPIPGRPCFEPVGETGELIRVHTKRVS